MIKLTQMVSVLDIWKKIKLEPYFSPYNINIYIYKYKFHTNRDWMQASKSWKY